MVTMDREEGRQVKTGRIEAGEALRLAKKKEASRIPRTLAPTAENARIIATGRRRRADCSAARAYLWGALRDGGWTLAEIAAFSLRAPGTVHAVLYGRRREQGNDD